jgi:hypothetical protein
MKAKRPRVSAKKPKPLVGTCTCCWGQEKDLVPLEGSYFPICLDCLPGEVSRPRMPSLADDLLRACMAWEKYAGTIGETGELRAFNTAIKLNCLALKRARGIK